MSALPSELEWEFPAEASSTRVARRQVVDALAERHLDGAGATAALVVGELAANALLLHARTRFRVRLLVRQAGRGAGIVRIEVTDGSSRAPRVRHFSIDAGSGRGLRLVDSLARSWGVELSENRDGKTVWAELEAGADSRPAATFSFDDVEAI